MDTEEKLAWIDKLVESKSFDELSHREKEFVLEELGSEEQYAALRKVSLTLVYSSTPDLSPGPDVLSSLKKRLHARHETAPLWARIFQVKIPAYAAVLAIIVCGVAVWKMSATPNVVLSSSTPGVTVVKDTVYVASRPDTVFVNRVVYRTARVTTPADKKIYTLVKNSSDAKEESSEGVSMEEKKELDKLLVSGSR